MKKRLFSLFLVLMMALTLLPATAVTAEAASPVVYNGNKMTTFQRSQSEVMARYNKAVNLNNGYVDGDSSTYYIVPASTSNPYNKGVLKPSTLEAMAEMANFYRYLVGVENAEVNTTSDDSLQAQALDRNFEFNHWISQDSKPTDMPQATWDEGYESNHSSLALYSTPRGSITSWLNEGYSLSQGDWGPYGIGHRMDVLSPSKKVIHYGYCGNVSIADTFLDENGYGLYSYEHVTDDNGDGVRDERDESYIYNNYTQGGYWGFKEAFSAFPAPGPMPNWVIAPSRSSWNVKLNLKKLRVIDASKVTVTVTNLTTQNAYTCTTANNKAQIDEEDIVFVQPSDTKMDGWRNLYGDSFRVDIVGLKEIPSKKDAKLTYTVNFFSQPPAAPTSVTAKVTGSNTAQITWSEVENADFYQVWRMDSKDATPGVCIGVYDAKTFSCTSRDLKPDTTYYYRVRAYKKVGDKKVYGSYGPTASATTKSTTKPAAPSGVTATAAGPDAVKVSWNKAEGAQFYQVWRMDKQGATPGVCIGVYTADTTSCTSRKLKPSTTYYYRVRAYKKVDSKDIYGDYSATVSAATKAVAKPAAPTGVSAKAAGKDAVQVTWGKVSSADFYQVWRMDKQGAAPGACIGVYDANTTSCTSRQLKAGTTYYYRVRAYKKTGDYRTYGDYSATVSATTQR